jgi:hypothetical protein
MQNRLTQHKLLLLLGATLLLASCMVGPNYVRPAAPVTPAYKEPPPQAYQNDIWRPARPGDRVLRTRWWELFGDDELNALEQRVDGANQELKAAEGRFREARALVGFARANGLRDDWRAAHALGVLVDHRPFGLLDLQPGDGPIERLTNEIFAHLSRGIGLP